MDNTRKKEIREKFGAYLKSHREEILKVRSVRQLSFSSNIDASKLTKIEKGLVNIEFDTLIEVAVTYKIEKKKLFGFVIELLEDDK